MHKRYIKKYWKLIKIIYIYLIKFLSKLKQNRIANCNKILEKKSFLLHLYKLPKTKFLNCLNILIFDIKIDINKNIKNRKKYIILNCKFCKIKY